MQNSTDTPTKIIRAAENATPPGVARGLNLAARIYRYGEGGVNPDGQKALELYEKLDELELLGEAEPAFSFEKALFNKAIARDDDEAFCEIEKIYR